MDRRHDEHREEGERDRRSRPAVSHEPAQPPVLALQQAAGNAAVARLLAREPAAAPEAAPAGWSFNPIAPGARQDQGNFTDAMNRASAAVNRWFGAKCDAIGPDNGPQESFAELVAQARELPVSGGGLIPTAGNDKVKDIILDVGSIERQLVEIARSKQVILRRNRSLDDPAGVAEQAKATVANLGIDPPDIKIGTDENNVTANLSGKVMLGKQIGHTELEGGGGAEGFEGGVKTPGAEGKIEVGPKGLKVAGKAGPWTVQVEAKKEDDKSGWGWKGHIGFGSLGKFVNAEDIAHAVGATAAAVGRTTQALSAGAKDAKEHEKPFNEQMSEVLEQAKKSAAQNKPGYQFGLSAEGDEKGGKAVGITFTVVF